MLYAFILLSFAQSYPVSAVSSYYNSLTAHQKTAMLAAGTLAVAGTTAIGSLAVINKLNKNNELL